MKLCLGDLANNHLIEEATEARELGTRQWHGGHSGQLGTEEHGVPCPGL